MNETSFETESSSVFKGLRRPSKASTVVSLSCETPSTFPASMLDMEMKLDDQKRPLLGFGNKAFNSDEITSVWRSLSKSSVTPNLEHPNHWKLFNWWQSNLP